MLISLSLQRDQRAVGQDVDLVRRLRCDLSVFNHGFLAQYVFLRLRIGLALGRIASALVLVEGYVQGVGFVFRPVNVLLRSRLLRVL